MGRPRRSKPDESVNLSFRADPALVAAIDREGAEMAAELKVRLSRSQVVMRLLGEALDRRALARSTRDLGSMGAVRQLADAQPRQLGPKKPDRE